MTDTRRRVKLYALNAERQWDDRGTGHVSSSYVDRLKGISLLVRAEADGSLLLESKIQPDTAYQKQQDTLIVWSEGDNFDLALSFQEKAGCDEIWEKICQVQGKDPSVDITQDVVEESEDERFEDVSDPAPPIELPTPEVSKLEEIQELFASCLGMPIRREKMALALETSEGYIKRLLILFRAAEAERNMPVLHRLFHIFKSIFLLNKNAIFELLFVEECIFDVVGCLEYEPGLEESQRKNHRGYLRERAKYQEVLQIPSDLLLKVHQTYRVQYIHDSVLPPPSAFEENMLSTLSSFIFFNKVEIVTLISEDMQLLNELFSELKTRGIGESRRRDLVLFLKELCAFAQNLQPQSRELFYKTLTSHGILPALELSLPIPDAPAKSAAIDVLTAVVEFSPTVVREYCLNQSGATDDEDLLLNVIIGELIRDKDPGLGGAVQLSGVLRLLIDPENMVAALNKSEKADFLNLFYKQSMHVLIEPLLSNTVSEKEMDEDLCTAQLLWLLLELLTFCVEHHSYHIKSYIINKDLVRRVLVLMSSSHTFLVLGALRLLRKVLALKDDLYNRYIIKGSLFAPVIEAFRKNNGRYNLLDSAIIELFDFLKADDTKLLVSHVMENYGDVLEEVNYVQTFRFLKLKYEQSQERFKERGPIESVPALLRTSRFRRDPRQLDEDEEMWFNDEEEAEDPDTLPAPRSPPDILTRKSNMDEELDSIGKLLDKKSPEALTGRGLGSLGNRSPSLTISSSLSVPAAAPVSNPENKSGLPSKSMFQEIFANYCGQGPVTQVGLVDYDGDSDDEEGEESDEGIGSDDSPISKRPKLS